MYICILTRDAGGAVNKDENHASKGPSDAEDADSAALIAAVGGVALALVANNGEHGDIQKEKSGNELSNQRPVKRPFGELVDVDQRRRWRVVVVLAGVLPRRLHCFHVLNHVVNEL